MKIESLEYLGMSLNKLDDASIGNIFKKSKDLRNFPQSNEFRLVMQLIMR
jgi:hypothetical protein